MSLLDRASIALLHRFDPERAHGLALKALNAGLVARPKVLALPRLNTRLCGLDLASPLGLAAGFDKNAEAAGKLALMGFGWLEVGAATPLPQPG
ncbi:MAG: dihydroorotate dehydrogenase (quinone), partial [Pseudomonadota bacterium]